VADGSFVLDGPAPTGRLGVAAIAAQGPGSFLVGKVEEALEFQAPAKDLVLRLPPKAPRGR
jgi:hypothetical protein